jgi:competence protein ComFC
MILNLKDNKFPGAFDFLAGELYETVMMRYSRIFDAGNVIITHVPRSNKAKKKAGHDQSKEIAERFGRLSGAPAVTLFENQSLSQQKQLSAEQRRENASESYRLCDENVSLAGKVLLMIDDITTTGATLCACAKLAEGAHAKAVIALVCARAESKGSVDEKDYLIYGEENEDEYWN